MNKRVTEMNNTLEWIDSRLTETEEQINELEYKIMEITALGESKEKERKEMRTVSVTSGAILKAQTFKF